MKSKIIGFHQDEHGDWVAELECGHGQHVRHNPPWSARPWVLTPDGRQEKIGAELECKECVPEEPFVPPTPRQGWDEQFAAMAARGDDKLLDADAPTSAWDKTEWH